MKKSWLVTKFAARHEITRPQPSVAAATEGGEPVRHSAANGPERSEGAQGKLREPGEGPAIFEALMKPRAPNSRTGPRS